MPATQTKKVIRRKKEKAKPIAIVCSDIHLSHVPPISRSVEKDWYEVQRRYLREIRDLCEDLPLFIAGDLFHTPDPPPSLINLAIENLTDKTDVYTVAGQHDLFHHNANNFGETAYGTLVLSAQITHVHPDGMLLAGFGRPVVLYGLSWEQELPDTLTTEDFPGSGVIVQPLQILIAHKFCYGPGDPPFPGVDPNQTAWDYAEELGMYGFHVAFLGDHHQDFIYSARDDLPTIVNCGGVQLRNITEKDRQPKVYELWDDGTVKPILLQSCKEDLWLEESQMGDKATAETPEFIQALKEIYTDELVTFEGAVLNYIRRKRPPERLRILLLKGIGRYEQ